MAKRRWQSWVREVVQGWGLYALALVAVVLAGRTRSIPLLLVACGLLAVAGILFQGQLGHDSVRTGIRLMVAAALLAAGAAATWFWAVGGHVEGWGFFGLTTFLFGVFQLLALVRKSRFLAPWRGPALIGFSAVLMIAGLVVLGPDRPGPAVPLVEAAAVAFVLGLPLMSEDLLGRLTDQVWIPWSAALAALLGLMLIAAAVDAFVLLGATVWYGFLTALALTALVGALAAHNDADLLIMVIALMLAWALLPRDAAPRPSQSGDKPVLVSLGDSYISGEGAKSFYRGTNTKGVNECRRAPTAYSPMIADERKDALLFLACSGAKAVDIYQNAQYEGEPLPSFIPTTAARQDSKGLSQLDQYEMVEGPPVDLVMVSIGGNDAGFSDIGHTCVAPNNCAETGQKWLADLPRVAKQVGMAFAAIREEFPNTPVLVVPYPVQLNPSGCAESLLSAPEHRFLVGFVNELNSVLEHEAARKDIQFHYVDTVPAGLAREHVRLCDGKFKNAGVNFLAANPVSGLLDHSVNPQNWIHDSFHPNEKGHRSLMRAIDAWIHDHPGLAPRAVLSGAGGDYQPRRLEDVMQGPPSAHCASVTQRSSYCHFDANGDLVVSRWQQSQWLQWLRKIAIPVSGLLAGAWLLWMAFIARWQRTRWARHTKEAIGRRLTRRRPWSPGGGWTPADRGTVHIGGKG